MTEHIIAKWTAAIDMIVRVARFTYVLNFNATCRLTGSAPNCLPGVMGFCAALNVEPGIAVAIRLEVGNTLSHFLSSSNWCESVP